MSAVIKETLRGLHRSCLRLGLGIWLCARSLGPGAMRQTATPIGVFIVTGCVLSSP